MRTFADSLLRKAGKAAPSVSGVPPIVHEVLRSPGQPLDSTTRAFMEPRFGHEFGWMGVYPHPCVAPQSDIEVSQPEDPLESSAARMSNSVVSSAAPSRLTGLGYDFGHVRIHTDARAAESARTVNAIAYTVGHKIVFGDGSYEPHTPAGRHLLAHELAHVIQQVPETGAPRAPRTINRVPDKASEDPDVLAPLPAEAVAGWYGRLADFSEGEGGDLSALFLRLWLKNRNPEATMTIPAHPHIITSSLVTATLPHHRSVYLTEEKGRFTEGGERWAGIIPRLQGQAGFQKWDGTGTLVLHYECLAEGTNPYVAAAQYKLGLLSKPDADVFTSLHGFQLRTDVEVGAAPNAAKKLTVKFQKFEASARDRYDWNPAEHLTMPNPDFGSKAPGAVRPDLKKIVVYHSNARRLEKAGMAAPYNLESKPWSVTNTAVTGSATIDPNKTLD